MLLSADGPVGGRGWLAFIAPIVLSISSPAIPQLVRIISTWSTGGAAGA